MLFGPLRKGGTKRSKANRNGNRANSKRALLAMSPSAERVASFLLERHEEELRRMVDEEDENAQYSLQVS